MKPSTDDFPMPIITPRLLLRPPELNDTVVVNAAISESFETLHAFMPWARRKPSLMETEAFVRQSMINWSFEENSEPTLPLLIFDINTQDFIGATGFHDINWDIPCVETGYWIREKYAGHGFMTEAVNTVTRYALNQIGFKRIEIRCDIHNVRSKKIPERLGYRLEAVLKSNRMNLLTGEPSDTLIYSRDDLLGLSE